MIAKAWNYFVSKISRKEEKQKPVLLPFAKPRPPPIVHLSKLTYSLRDRPQQGTCDAEFGVIVSGVEQFSQEMEGSQQAELAQQLINEIRTLEDQLKRMHINTRKINQSQKECQTLDSNRVYLYLAQKQRQAQRQLPSLEYLYEYQIIGFLELKYEKEKENFPLIPKQSFDQVMSYWQDKKHPPSETIRKTNLKSVEKLTYKAIKTIDQGNWLNDDVVNISIELMEKQFSKAQIKLMNSFFATTTLSMQQSKKITRFIKKQLIEPSHVIIFPVHWNRNHWIFAKFNPEVQTLTIYDSLCKNAEYYLQNPQNLQFQNALKFAKFLYGKDFELVVCDNYPQQNNGSDCGMFMLNGIRDCLRGQEWTFEQYDMRYKRYQLAWELLKQDMSVSSS